MYAKIVSSFLFFLWASGFYCDDNIVVTTNYGKIKGYKKTTYSQKEFLAFEGIPYARPPIGPLRFEPPQPAEKWSQTLQATTLHSCLQIANRTISGSEDCLYLNIYIPKTKNNNFEFLDVIVHIHGGGFMALSGHFYTSPDYFIDSNMIFVTFNYRLGAFGFLSTEDEIVPGNNGLKDQVLALKWIKNNIRNFGGNPDSLTITGASAGGASVHLHYFSKQSEGLFSKGFSQSGSALNPWVLQKGALGKVRVIGGALNCPLDENQALIRCLKEKKAEDIVGQYYKLEKYGIHPIVLFGPIVEKSKENAFLDEEPYQKLLKKEVLNAPWIVSFVAHEAVSLVETLRPNRSQVFEKFSDIVPHILCYDPNYHNVSEKIEKFYFKFDNNEEENFKILTEMVTENFMHVGIIQSAFLQAESLKAPVYLFNFSYTGREEFVNHGDDERYSYYNAKKPLIPEEMKMKDVFMKMVKDYASTGKPTLPNIDWKPLQPGHNLKFLNIRNFNDIGYIENSNPANIKFWESLKLPY